LRAASRTANAGDFEIVDRIYRCHTTADPKLANWDHYALMGLGLMVIAPGKLGRGGNMS